MESNTSRPWWLTEQRIEQLKNDLAKYPNPYDGEPLEIIFDAPIDMDRYKAQSAYDILTEYRIPF